MARRVEWNFVRAVAGTEFILQLATVPDDEEFMAENVWFTRISSVDLRKLDWAYVDVRSSVADMTVFREPVGGRRYFVSLSTEGEIQSYGDIDWFEAIPGAGVYRESRDRQAPGGGYMHAINQIGDHLYACGDSGQLFKRAAPDDWHQVDLSLLEDLDERTRVMRQYHEEARQRYRDLPLAERLERSLRERPFFQSSLYYDVAGPSEDQIYIAGSINETRRGGYVGGLWFWNGQQTRRLDLPTTDVLSRLYVESDDVVWAIGRHGTLLRGNHRDGFVDLSRRRDRQLWQSITMLDGIVYLGSGADPQGLFRYDPGNPGAGIVRVRTGLDPEHTDVHIVDAAGGALWSVGFRDIVRFDGTTWRRIYHPDNPRIGR